MPYNEFKVSFGDESDYPHNAINIAAKTRREAVKLYGLVLHHKGVLRKLGSDPCCVRVQLADNLNERGQFFKLWCAEEKIYAESYISMQMVSWCEYGTCMGRGACTFMSKISGGN